MGASFFNGLWSLECSWQHGSTNLCCVYVFNSSSDHDVHTD